MIVQRSLEDADRVHPEEPSAVDSRPENGLRPRPFPMLGGVPVVAVDLDDTLCHYDGRYHPDVIGLPRPFAIWALEVFAYNGYEVVLHTNRSNLRRLRQWIDDHAPGLVHHVNDHPRAVHLGMNPGKPVADLFIDDRDSRFRGRPVDWIPLMQDLLGDGFLPNGFHREPTEHEKHVAGPTSSPALQEVQDRW